MAAELRKLAGLKLAPASTASAFDEDALYALMASGLTLIFGVMRVINLAHGAFAILAAFLTYTLWQHLGLDPPGPPGLAVPGSLFD